MWSEYLLMFVGFAVLLVAADVLVSGASGLAKRLNVPNLVIGLTIVAFGTSAPELVVNLVASFDGTNEIALTNILGSNIINTLVILGMTAMVFPIPCKRCTLRYEIPMSVMAGAAVLLLGSDALRLHGNGFSGMYRTDGAVLLAVFACFLGYTIYQAKHQPCGEHDEIEPMKIWKAAVMIAAGLAGLVIGGRLIVDMAVKIAEAWGVAESVIGVTVVALGTSLPELATSVTAAFKRNTDLAIGNVIGSNIFNVFFVLGVSSVINPLAVYENFTADASMAMLSSLILLPFIALSRKHEIKRWEGVLMLVIYGVYLGWLLDNL